VRTRIHIVRRRAFDPSRAEHANLTVRLPRNASLGSQLAVRAGGRIIATTALRTVAAVADP